MVVEGRVGSLFAGIGGFDLGFEQAGFETAWQVEIDKFCNRVLQARWPGVRRYGDIREIDPAEIEPVGIVTGGFPCQDLSVAGRRAGLGGERSGLWWELRRILAVLRPRWVVIENVPGLLSSNRGRDMGAILAALGDLGYGWSYRVLDAQWFGLAQRRKRVFIVGCFGDGTAAAKVLLEPEGGGGTTAAGRAAGPTGATLLATGAGTSRPGAATLNSGGNSGGFRSEPCEHLVVARTLTASSSSRYNLDTETFVPVIREAQIAFRRFAPRECERLQGFPDGWTCLCEAQGDTMSCRCPDSPRYRALGNAVAVPVARWIAERIATGGVWGGQR